MTFSRFPFTGVPENTYSLPTTLTFTFEHPIFTDDAHAVFVLVCVMHDVVKNILPEFVFVAYVL